MDIYILSEPVITVIRLLLWNVLHFPGVIVVIVCFVGGLLIPIPVSSRIVRKVGILRAAILGMDLKGRMTDSCSGQHTGRRTPF